MLLELIKLIVRYFHVEHAYNVVVVVIVVWFFLWIAVELMQAVGEMLKRKR